ncbi:hypothetical protein PQR62_13280 [Herbaspirillum lusitanum]|uniref:Uncharacterized protein n=1 Tax=Herbaspirillum lusitanum TaxID=213312 RepID=A0ABW9ABU2_9BURK
MSRIAMQRISMESGLQKAENRAGNRADIHIKKFRQRLRISCGRTPSTPAAETLHAQIDPASGDKKCNSGVA